MSSGIDQLQKSRLRGLIRDFTSLLTQQMYFWGRDVVHPEGNLLTLYGFDRRTSEGLNGTSCYRTQSSEGAVELHGACVGSYSSNFLPGFLFIRNRRRCFLYRGSEPPIPGFYAEDLLSSGPVFSLYHVSCQFLNWWLAYEEWIESTVGSGHRKTNFRAFKKLPTSRAILPPDESLQWLREYQTSPESLKRIREWQRTSFPTT